MLSASNILVATDFSPCSDEAVACAFQLAAASSGKVHLLHVFTLDAMSEAELLTRDGMHDAERHARQKLRLLATQFRCTEHLGETLCRAGDPASLINLVAAQINADLVVVGTHGRRGLRRLLVGSVAARVVRGAPCAVWVVRPPPDAQPTARSDSSVSRPLRDVAP